MSKKPLTIEVLFIQEHRRGRSRFPIRFVAEELNLSEKEATEELERMVSEGKARREIACFQGKSVVKVYYAKLRWVMVQDHKSA